MLPLTRSVLSSTLHRTASSGVGRYPLRLFSASSTRRGDAIPFVISSRGTGVAQTVSVAGSPQHTIQTDAYAAFGGADSAPSPLHYNLAALSSCTQVTGAIVAKEQGLTLGEWQVDVTGKLDPAVLANGEPDNGSGGNWNSVELKVRVEAGGIDGVKFNYRASEIERRCPVTQLFKRSGVGWGSFWEQAKRDAIPKRRNRFFPFLSPQSLLMLLDHYCGDLTAL